MKETREKESKWWFSLDGVELTLLGIMALAMAILISLLVQ